MTVATKACAHCGEPFTRQVAQAAKQTYCSRKCMADARRTLAPCPTCGGPRRRARQEYCSRACIPSPKITARCAMCLAPFETYRSRPRRYCARSCYAQHLAMRQAGKRSHLWKGGKRDDARRIRNHPAYATWRTKVFERDQHTCQACHQVGGHLTAHHVVRFSADPKLRLKVSNGVTLCWPCHQIFHANEAEIGVQERRLADRVEKFLTAEPGVWHLKIHGSGMQRNGIPDFLVCVAGRMAAIELKIHPNFASPIQAYELTRINAAGGHGRVCRSLEDVAALIDAVKSIDQESTP